MKIHDSAISANARKVRLLAAELGLPLDRHTLDFAKGELRSPEYKAMNPNGKVPTFEDDDGFLLWESGAILRWLAAKRPDRGLVPSDPKKAALVDQWMFWWTAHPEPAMYGLVVEHLVKPFLKMEPSEALIRDHEQQLGRFLPVLDHQLDGKEHVVGQLTIADFLMAPWLAESERLKVDLAPHANIRRWLEGMMARPSWKTP